MVHCISQSHQAFLGFLLSLIVVAIQTAPINAYPDTLKLSVQSTPSPCSQHVLSKRAVGAIPISSGPSGLSTRFEVAKRAVGTVADPGTLCDSLSSLHTATALHVRSVPTHEPSFAPGQVKQVRAKKPVKPTKPRTAGEPDSEKKWGRAQAW